MCDKTKEEKYIELLVVALQMFYEYDAKTLFSDNVADERAMVGCIYRYAWCLLQDPCYADLEQDIDIEYDRMSSRHAKKAFDQSIDHKYSCIHDIYEKCGKVICCQLHNNVKMLGQCDVCMRENKKWREFRPDLIIHKRGSPMGEGNGMIVEFKKKHASPCDIKFDKAKVMYCTCQRSDFRYLIGAFVLLHKDKCEVHVAKNGMFCIPFAVDARGRMPKE